MKDYDQPKQLILDFTRTDMTICRQRHRAVLHEQQSLALFTSGERDAVASYGLQLAVDAATSQTLPPTAFVSMA